MNNQYLLNSKGRIILILIQFLSNIEIMELRLCVHIANESISLTIEQIQVTSNLTLIKVFVFIS